MTVGVVIADDSDFFREVLKEVLEEDGDLRVLGEAADGRRALEVLRRVRPGLLFIDLNMPGPSGLAVIEEVMATAPLPIILITAQRRDTIAFEAMRHGALEVLDKEVVAQRPGWLRALARQLATVPVVVHPRRHARPELPTPLAPAATARAPQGGAGLRVVGVGASAGGPPAVAAFLAGLPATASFSVAVVQHLTTGFAPSYARFLAAECRWPVRLVDAPTPIEPNVVYVATDEQHLTAGPAGWRLSRDGPWPFRPSIDALFLSLAAQLGPRAGGVVLSGMGDDGAQGLAGIARAGGLALVQDEATAAVFGMPREAHRVVPTARALSPAQLAAAVATEGGP